MPNTPNSSSNTLIIVGSLTGLAFIVVGGVVALAYTDGHNASIILPVLLGLVGPLIMSIIALSKSVENGQKADTAVQQNQYIASTLDAVAKVVSTPTPPIIIHHTDTPTEAPPSGPA